MLFILYWAREHVKVSKTFDYPLGHNYYLVHVSFIECVLDIKDKIKNRDIIKGLFFEKQANVIKG